MKKRMVCPGSGNTVKVSRLQATVECPGCGVYHMVNKDKTIRHHKVLSSA